MPRTGSSTLDKGLSLFNRILADEGATGIGALAEEMGLAASTARRMVAAFERQGLLIRASHGRYIGGPALYRFAGDKGRHRLLTLAARAHLARLARDLDVTAHLGVLETDMVTYLVKEGRDGRVISTESMQLEAYCSGIGKALLAFLDAAARETYVAAGGFVALTAQTIIDPDGLRDELARIRQRGFAIDNREIADDLVCLAVPLLNGDGVAVAALSVSGALVTLGTRPVGMLLERLTDCADRIAHPFGLARPPSVLPTAGVGLATFAATGSMA